MWQRTGRRFACPRYPVLRRSGPGDASFVRELPGTGSKICRLGVPDTAKVTGFRAAPQPFADKSAPTPCGQKHAVWQRTGRPSLVRDIRSFVGADRATLRLSANCREPAVKPAASQRRQKPALRAS
ncbi:hypothetical protein BKM03_12485 [Pseudomonas avellanae]|uniref:Uncharacterized protein n=1 Tax=Pseudomonas avellanae TaxID=46257 RepID=A0AAD0DXI0_9PSED|nr:hypothetical protein BKM03_12485 [Pseudomonas avellanae]